jgi:hypothetical protein
MCFGLNCAARRSPSDFRKEDFGTRGSSDSQGDPFISLWADECPIVIANGARRGIVSGLALQPICRLSFLTVPASLPLE